MTTKTAINYDNALAHVEVNATLGVASNFKALAAGTMAFMIGQTWADKDNKVPADNIKADILARFKDSGDKKSKAYEFGALSLTIARELSKGDVTADRSWHTELRDVVQAEGASLEDGIDFLAARFHSIANTVSALALHFKGEKEKKAKPINFMDGLEKLCEKVLESGQTVPAFQGIQLLIALGVSYSESTMIIARLVKDWDSEKLAHLMGHINDMMVQVQAKESAIVQAEAEAEAEAEAIAA